MGKNLIVNILLRYRVLVTMGKRLFIIAIWVIFITLFSDAGGAVRNSAISNPAGSGAVVQSSVRSGLVPAVNPIDRSSNLVVTGNIAGGKHFRGVVPYNAVTDFAGVLGSTSLDSFLRRSSGLGWSKSRPYHSQTATVAATRAGSRSIFRPPTARIDDRARDNFALPSLSSVKGKAINQYGVTRSTNKIRGLRI